VSPVGFVCSFGCVCVKMHWSDDALLIKPQVCAFLLQRRAVAHIKSEQEILSELCRSGLSNRVSHGSRLSRRRLHTSNPAKCVGSFFWKAESSKNFFKGGFLFFFLVSQRIIGYQWISAFLECSGVKFPKMKIKSTPQ